MEPTMTHRARLLVLCSWIATGAGCGDNVEREVQESPPADPTIVQVADGDLQGTLVGDSRQFLGIPYAKPPVGALRWRAPQKPEPWSDLRSATTFSKRCAQVANLRLQNAASTVPATVRCA